MLRNNAQQIAITVGDSLGTTGPSQHPFTLLSAGDYFSVFVTTHLHRSGTRDVFEVAGSLEDSYKQAKAVWAQMSATVPAETKTQPIRSSTTTGIWRVVFF